MTTRPAVFANAYAKKYGLALVPIPPGQKAPARQGWNQPGGYIVDAEEANRYWVAHPREGMGVVLGPSGLCSLDVDNVEHARGVLAEFGVDIDALAGTCPTVVGNPVRFRILFAAPVGADLQRHALTWPTQDKPGEKFTLFELRAGPVQDVLPPTIHPDTGKEYFWRTRPNGPFPALPEELLTIWRDWRTVESYARSLCPWGIAPSAAARPKADIIGPYNEKTDIAELLESHGYTRHGKRYRAPGCDGMPGVVFLDDGRRVYSHNANDLLSDEHSHDAFDVLRILDHGGDFTAAVRAAAQALGMEPPQRQPALRVVASQANFEAPAKAGKTSTDPKLDATVAELAKLLPLDFDRVRDVKAKEMGVRASTLDAEISKLRKSQSRPAELQGAEVKFEELKPWHDPVDGARLLEELTAAIRRYVVLPETAAHAGALWVVHAHCVEAFEHTPRLNVSAPEKQCGKSLLLDVIEQLVPRPIHADNMTTAVLFRVIDQHAPALLIDECDSFLIDNEELRGAVNAGHKRGGQIWRCEGESNEVRGFKVFAPMVLAGIGDLPGTITDRSIIIRMKRALAGEIVERFDSRRVQHLHDLTRQAARWALDNRSKLERSDPAMPECLYNRSADNWRALLAIADAAGGDWPEQARRAAKALTVADSGSDGIGVELLTDIASVFEKKGVDRISSADLIEALCADPERRWPTFNHGKAMSPRQLARRLGDFGICSNTLRLPDETRLKGYQREQFEEAFERYLPRANAGIPPSYPCERDNTIGTGISKDFASVTEGSMSRIGNPPKPALDKACHVVTDKNPQTGVRLEL